MLVLNYPALLTLALFLLLAVLAIATRPVYGTVTLERLEAGTIRSVSTGREDH